MTTGHPLDGKSKQLQEEIDRISQRLGVSSMPVGLRTNVGLNVYVAEDGSHHFANFERGKLYFDRVGDLDDLPYWYAKGIVGSQAARQVGDREQRFAFGYRLDDRN